MNVTSENVLEVIFCICVPCVDICCLMLIRELDIDQRVWSVFKRFRMSFSYCYVQFVCIDQAT